MSWNHVFSDKEARWLFGDKVLRLQELAAFQFTWKLWSGIMLSGKYHDVKSELKVALGKTVPIVLKFIRNLKVAASVERELIYAADQVKSQLLLWMIYNQEQMLSSGRKIILYTCHVKYATFKPNTKFDYVTSARKMIQAKQFDERIAFEVMCRFCMEEELEKLPKDGVKKLLKKITFDKCPLAWHWIQYLTDKETLEKLREMVYEMRGRCCLEGSLILHQMDVDNWQNIEWLWRRLCDEVEQMEKAAEILRDINKSWFLRDFYFVFNEEQWRYVFNTVPVDILFAFFRHYQKIEQGCFLWKRLRDSMTSEQFADLMRRLLKPKEKASDWCFPTIAILWNTAPDHFKNHILEEENSIVIDNFFETSFIRRFDRNLQFLFELLSFASIEYRENMILTHGDVLFQVDDFSKIDKIVELCLPDASQRDKFELFLSGSEMIEDRCQELFVNGDFTLLNKFFESFCHDESVVNDYRKRLLSSEITCEAFIFEPNKWRDFEKFVGSVDSNSPLYTVVRDQVLGSCELFYFDNWSNIEQLDFLEKVFVQFFTREEELVKLKRELLDELQDMLSSFFATFLSCEGKFFTAEFLEKFISWANSDDDVFKSKLPIDSIFASTFTSMLSETWFENAYDLLELVAQELLPQRGKLDSKILVALDELLKWYFGGAEQAKKYKLAKMFAFDDTKFFRVLNEAAKIDDGNVDTVLAWMLENDEEEIRKFKAKFDYEDVLNKSSMLSL